MRTRINIAVLVFFGALVVATTLIGILLRNPATHSNLEDPEHYDRTELAYLDTRYTYAGYATGESADVIADIDIAGRVLYVRLGCISCHGEYAEGATIAPALWDSAHGDFARDVRDGPSGMPAYPVEILSDDDLELLYDFIRTVPAEAAALGVTATTAAPPTPVVTTTVPAAGEGTTESTTAPESVAAEIEAPVATITVDGNPSEWNEVAGFDVVLEPIEIANVSPMPATIKVAHDGTSVFVLFAVADDFNWSPEDPHLSGAPAVMWSMEMAAGPHMGGDDPSGRPGLGMVDIWYWRLECPAGQPSGGAVSGPGDGDPGNDGACGLDDEWATDPSTNEDDAGPLAENSLLGAFSHTNPVEDGEGTWFFEVGRPLQTGDPQDAQFTVGGVAHLALAYWDPDARDDGWGRIDHLQSSYLGWLDVRLAD
jgi:hypothetical protein